MSDSAMEKAREAATETIAPIIEKMESRYPERIIAGAVLDALVAAGWEARTPEGERITHGRHCVCTPCASQDWTDSRLAACGMHGPACPAVYAPLGVAGDRVAFSEARSRDLEALREPTDEMVERLAEYEWEQGNRSLVASANRRITVTPWAEASETEKLMARCEARAALRSALAVSSISRWMGESSD